MTNLAAEAAELLRLHTDPELLTVVNVWDVITAKVVAAVPGTKALATASHSIAASHGYPDGEAIPRDLMLETIGRIARAVDLPVSADLEAGYGDPGDTVARAIDLGVVGANLEDRMAPVTEAARAVEAAVAAGERAGIPFVLNARTDAYLRGRDRDPEELLADVIERGRAYLGAGAACFFVPGRLDERTVARLVEALGERKISIMGGARIDLPLDRAGAGCRARLLRAVHAERRARRGARPGRGRVRGRGTAAGPPAVHLTVAGSALRDDIGSLAPPNIRGLGEHVP